MDGEYIIFQSTKTKTNLKHKFLLKSNINL